MPDFTKGEGAPGLPPVPPSSVYTPPVPVPAPARPVVSSPPPPRSPAPAPSRSPGRRWPVWALALGVFAAIAIPGVTIVLILGTGRGNSTQAPTPRPALAATPGGAGAGGSNQIIKGNWGEVLTPAGYGLVANDKDESQDFSGSGIGAAKAGDKLVAVHVMVAYQDGKSGAINPLYFFLRDNKGKAFDLVLAGKSPQLEGVDQSPSGEWVSGWLTYEVPASAQGLVLSYEPPGAGLIFQVPLP